MVLEGANVDCLGVSEGRRGISVRRDRRGLDGSVSGPSLLGREAEDAPGRPFPSCVNLWMGFSETRSDAAAAWFHLFEGVLTSELTCPR